MHTATVLPSTQNKTSRLSQRPGQNDGPIRLVEHSALQLICLDYLEWMGNGKDVAEQLHCSQSCISRQSRNCLQFFRLSASRHNGELHLHGDQHLLTESRRLHQLFRLSGLAPARIEAPAGLLVSSDASRLHHLSTCNRTPKSETRIVSLVERHIVDIWIKRSSPTKPHNKNGLQPRLINISVRSNASTHSDGEELIELTCLPEVLSTSTFRDVMVALTGHISAPSQ